MIDWVARARARFSETAATPTDETDKRGVSSVSSVRPPAVCRSREVLSSVSSVSPAAVCEKRESVLTTTQSCVNCRHLSRVKTCRQPVAAGLLTEIEGFGIVWPEAAHGAACPAWTLNPAEATMAVLVAAGRGGWSDELMHQWLKDADEHPRAVLDLLHHPYKV